jgi:hypothetical protein
VSRIGTIVSRWPCPHQFGSPRSPGKGIAIAHRYIESGKAGKRLTGLADAGILHDHHRSLAVEVRTRNDPGEFGLTRDRDIVDARHACLKSAI